VCVRGSLPWFLYDEPVCWCLLLLLNSTIYLKDQLFCVLFFLDGSCHLKEPESQHSKSLWIPFHVDPPQLFLSSCGCFLFVVKLLKIESSFLMSISNSRIVTVIYLRRSTIENHGLFSAALTCVLIHFSQIKCDSITKQFIESNIHFDRVNEIRHSSRSMPLFSWCPSWCFCEKNSWLLCTFDF